MEDNLSSRHLVANGIIESVKNFISNVDSNSELADADVWDDIPKEIQAMVDEPAFGEKVWNVIPPKTRKLMRDPKTSVDTAKYLIDEAVNSMGNKIEINCFRIRDELTNYLLISDGKDAIDILRFYAKNTRHEVRTALSTGRQSGAAFSDDTDACSTKSVPSMLTADDIHHNMFRGDEGGLDSQKFTRFKFPLSETFYSLLSLEDPDIITTVITPFAEVLEAVRSFLSRLSHRPTEQTTQACKYPPSCYFSNSSGGEF